MKQDLALKQAVAMQEKDMYMGIAHYSHDIHKKSRGHVWVLGGSVGFTGAPSLAACGAMVSGVGLVSIACPEIVWPVLAASNLEVMVHPEQQGAWQQADLILAGPGWGVHQEKLLEALLRSDIALVLDADALNILAENHDLAQLLCDRLALTVLTPHPGEAARLLNTTAEHIQQHRLESVLRLRAKFSCAVVLKGAGTLVAFEDELLICPFGSVYLARAGTGDVLAGVLSGLLAQAVCQSSRVDLKKIISKAVVWHAIAGENRTWYRAGQLPQLMHALIAR
ncbi:MAG: NAD(P)H-hydrate dehydratase [Mariprofundaceae bacterium]